MNKKWFISAMALALSISTLLSQQITFGPVSGVSFSKYKINFVDPEQEAYFSVNYKIGYHFGATMDYQFGGRFGVQPSILFSQKGSKIEYIKPASTTTKESYSTNHTLNYIDVPILFKYKLGTPDHGVALMAGPNIGVGIGGTYTETGIFTDSFVGADGNTYTGQFKVNETDKPIRFGKKVNDNFKKSTIGFTFGVGSYFEIGESGKLIIEARYNLGGKNILNGNYIYGVNAKDNGANQPITLTGVSIVNNSNFISSVQTRNIQLSLGYLFEF